MVAAFTVAIGSDDMAYTYFTGEDGEEQTAGLIAFYRIYEWLVGIGVVASPGEMVEIGNELHLEPE